MASRNREYWEKGCKCILKGEVKKAPKEVEDKDLWEYYNLKCKCGRGYKHA